MLISVICLVFPALLFFAAAHDVRTLTIPNWVSIALTAAFIPAALLAGLSLAQTGMHLLVGFIALVIGAALFFMRIWGGGDAKLVAAAMVWLGAAASMKFIFGIALCGGILAFVLIVGRRAKLKSSIAWMARLFSPKTGVPYGVAIAFGAIFAASSSPVLVQGMQAVGL